MIVLKSLKYIQEAKPESPWCVRKSRDEIKYNRHIFYKKIVTKNFPNSENKVNMPREDTLHHTLYSGVRSTK